MLALDDLKQQVLSLVRKYELPLDAEAIDLYIETQIALHKNPKDPDALVIADHFKCILWWAKDDTTFEDFIIAPQCPPTCPWCRAFGLRANKRSLEFFAASGIHPEARSTT